MKKALIAAVACGALLASQALADTNSATVNFNDRAGSDASDSSNFAGLGGMSWLYLLLAAGAIGGAAWAISDSGNNNPTSP